MYDMCEREYTKLNLNLYENVERCKTPYMCGSYHERVKIKKIFFTAVN